MVGKYHITVTSKWLRYDFDVKRKITIIQGDSATGKTTLIQLIQDIVDEKSGPGTSLYCPVSCVVLSGNLTDAVNKINQYTEAVIFVDEQERFLYTKEFAESVMNSPCYFVFITRDDLSMLPYSINEIYCLKNSGYYQNTRQTYNSMHQIYPELLDNKEFINPDIIITEDTNSGFEMFEAVAKEKGIDCVSAGGKSNVGRAITDYKEKSIVAIVDGAAFGADIKKALHRAKYCKDAHIYAPESFEYLLLQSGILEDRFLAELNNTEEYAESSEYASWERYYTELITKSTQGSIYKYSKSKLNNNYLTEGNIKKVKNTLPYNIDM